MLWVSAHYNHRCPVRCFLPAPLWPTCCRCYRHDRIFFGVTDAQRTRSEWPGASWSCCILPSKCRRDEYRVAVTNDLQWTKYVGHVLCPLPDVPERPRNIVSSGWRSNHIPIAPIPMNQCGSRQRMLTSNIRSMSSRRPM